MTEQKQTCIYDVWQFLHKNWSLLLDIVNIALATGITYISFDNSSQVLEMKYFKIEINVFGFTRHIVLN